jgi:DNA-binding transcriptional ArsR family regulator
VNHVNHRLVFLTLALFGSSLVQADSAPHQVSLDHSFAGQRLAILAALDDGEVYKELSSEDRSRVMEHLQQISEALEGAEMFRTLSPARQTVVINSQDLVNQLLTKAADDSRLVCVHQHRLGTRIREAVCMTKGERDRITRDTRRDAEDRLRHVRVQQIKG